MKKLFTLFILLCTFSISFGQWGSSTAQGEKVSNGSSRDQYYTLDINQLKNQLSKAQTPGQYSKPVEISIPVLGSGVETFEIYSLPVVVPELASKYQLGSYVGVAKNDKNKYIRFSLAPGDFQSMIIINGVSQFIEPLNKSKSLYRVFPKTINTGKKSFICSTEENTDAQKQIKDLAALGNSFGKSGASDFSKSSDKKYRTLRLAMSVTAEYTNSFGGVTQALTAVNATLTRVNGVFEKDFGLHMNLQNYPALIYTNTATDPYSPAAQMNLWNNQLQQTLTSVVGDANYDIGHLFGASGGGGNAGCIGCICIAPTGPTNNGKGSGITSPGSGLPQGDTFDIDYVAHEIGHQLGGNHTFSNALEGTGVNMEPGSGSTIMGYAGITGPTTDVQANSDPYFHAASISQIQTNLISKTCDIETSVTNNPPVFTALPAYNIPKGTAFVLTGSATDPENDPMTFTWEQVNSATTTTNNSNIGNLTNGPSFRSVLPTTGGNVRYFPRLSSVLAGVLNNSNNLWEAVPTVARTMQFALTARDNSPAFNQQQTQNTVQNITVGNDGPFTVTSTTGSNNAAVPITWNVVNTAAAPYNVANVKIDYTINNGASWVTLIASTPNDGTEAVTFTGLTSGSSAIVRVSAVDNVFYAVKTINIVTSTACNTNPPVGIVVTAIAQTTATVSWTSDPTATYILRYRIVGSPTWTTINPSTTPANLVGLTGSSQYEVQIATICLGVTGSFSPSTNFATPGLVYCIPTGGTSSTTYYLNNITTTLGITNLAYTASSYSAYVDNSANTFISIPGGIVNVSLGSAGGSTYYFYVWIDWNNDGDFLDAGETILATTTYTSTGAAVINVPAAQAAGNYRVRFSTSFIGTNTSCGPGAWGNYVDYTLIVGPAPTCLSPTNPVASAVSTTTATISWTASTSVPANGYEYFISTTNVAPTATTIPTGTSATTSVNLTGLALNTTYYFWVRAVCSATDSSYWTSGGSFLTTQIPATIPYIQPFTGPNDFVFVNGTQSNKWSYGAAAGNPANSIYISDNNGLANSYSGTTTIVHAYRDIIVPTGTTNATFLFDWKAVGEGTSDLFKVWLVPTSFNPVAGTQITAGAGKIQVGGNFNLQSTWQTYFNPTLNLSTFAGATVRIVYEWRNDSFGFTNTPAAIDNINLIIPTCQVPTNLSVTAITAVSATLNWTAAVPVPANGYQYYVSTSNVPPTATTVPTGTTTATTAPLTGLSPTTIYYYWVRSACSTTSQSLWFPGGNFTTGQIPTTIPYTQPFTGPNDWVFINGTQNNKWVYGSATGNPANSIYISNDNGATNSYSTTSSVVQAYRDFIVPAGSNLATFFYDWKAVGESSFDYFRVWLVPVSFTPTAGTQITAGTGRIQVGGNLNQQAAWQTNFNPTLNISSFAGQTMRLVFEWRNDTSVFNDPPVAIDNINLLIPTCQVPTNLIANPVGSTTATISWTAATPAPALGYQYYISTVNVAPIGTTVPTGSSATTTANLTGLLPNTTYYFWVRSRCSTTDTSLWMAGTFTTGQIPATIPYIQPFTGPNDFGTTTGTQVNKWVYGAATGNTGNSLYISNDAGVTNSYTISTTSVTHAYRDFNIVPLSTTVELSFDWKAVGESSFDYLRVWAVPISYVPVAGTQITAAGGTLPRVQIGANFNQQATWQSYQNLTFNVAPYITSGMRLVFEWRNDGSGGTQPPVAIDNVKLVRCDITPPIVTVSNVLSTSAVLTWNNDPGGATYRVRYRVAGTVAWVPAFTAVANSGLATNTYTITGLTPLTSYEAEVAAVCNGTVGSYTPVTFTTRCDPTPPGNFTVSNITAYTADLSWNTTLSASYTVQYREVGSTTWITVLLPGTNFQLTGLTPYTTYEVQVASICSGATNPYGTPKVFTTLPICEMAPIGLTVTNLTISSAQVDWNSFPNATYVLMYREVGFNNWVTVNLNTNTYIITGLLEQTQYEVKVANVCNGVTQVYTAPYVFTTPTVIYCDMSSVSSTAEHISNVKVTPNGKPEMNNDSNASNYTSYTGDPIKVVQLVQGSTNNVISVSKTWSGSTTYDEAVTVWIDFNRDGIFSNNERILTSPASKTTPVTANFNVPSNAFVSLVDNRFVVMRVALSRGSAPVMCGQFQNGEVEDYKVRISKPNAQNLLDANSAVMVYPNPVKNILNITKVKDGTKYKIYNAIGQLVMKGTIFANKVDVSRLINGVFIIEVESPDDNAQVKFIKE
ncbi:fibronectin type III domain-containing protein [Frigoriflavimonas asaccharolytica]|uniref:Fibronectin type-III domain-containing protein n=1 Tax=Frigoriflavimonas asaccharolytica TaxID=2735899 RepID=A0A8J8GCT0_9FLAO|nr:fibronectin type III domain-containing protein [Frigoriflavimonas asaccharolytica]NRS93869.1 hypothetical protein [Frigoriflavimonas asaccharolytica]